jgi:hypothetical protein
LIFLLLLVVLVGVAVVVARVAIAHLLELRAVVLLPNPHLTWLSLQTTR